MEELPYAVTMPYRIAFCTGTTRGNAQPVRGCMGMEITARVRACACDSHLDASRLRSRHKDIVDASVACCIVATSWTLNRDHLYNTAHREHVERPGYVGVSPIASALLIACAA